MAVVGILREESMTELFERNLHVAITIVAAEPQVDFLARRENPNRCETVSYLSVCQDPITVYIKNSERVWQVHV